MGIVKAISGHTGARGVMRYLERDGRALARDFLNIGVTPEMRDAAALAAEALGEEDYENLA